MISYIFMIWKHTIEWPGGGRKRKGKKCVCVFIFDIMILSFIHWLARPHQEDEEGWWMEENLLLIQDEWIRCKLNGISMVWYLEE